MGKIVTIMNMKGGVGKTTLAMHFAGMAARYDLDGDGRCDVLALDYDPQFNMSQAFLESDKYFKLEKDRKTMIAVLQDDDSALNPFVLQVPGNNTPPNVKDISTSIYNFKNGGRLDLVPSTLDLMYVALGQATTNTKPIEERFAKFAQECKSKYDLTIIDCHPAGSLFTKTSLHNSDHVVIPVVPQSYAVRGIGLMLDFIVDKSTGKHPTPHIVFNMTSRSGPQSSEEVAIRSNKKFSKYCLNNTLHRYSAFSDPEAGGEFVWTSKQPYSTLAFLNLRNVAKELFGRMGVRT